MSTQPRPKSPKYFDDVPSSEDEWKRYAMAANVVPLSLYDFDDFKSASKVSQKQFLLLRTIIEDHGTKFDAEKFDLREEFEKAKKALDKSDEFQGYLQDVEGNTNNQRNLFHLVRKHQLEILAKPLKSKYKLSTHDETPVNSACINLSQGAYTSSTDSQDDWRHSKVAITADFSRGDATNKDRKYRAITDGQLQHTSTYEIKALVECKKDIRSECSPQVDMQEAAQMVAWIKEYPGKRRRPLVSQDGKEIFITFAQYDDQWLGYLYGNHRQLGFMYMYRFGPYHIDNWEELKVAAAIILAIGL